MSTTRSVMPMVDHLEELRRRMLWSLGAVALATAVALSLVFAFPVILWLELPIRAYLPAHKLAFTHPTEPFDIAMHTSIAFGIVLSLPAIVYQAWGFVRPAMSRGEGRILGWGSAAHSFSSSPALHSRGESFCRSRSSGCSGSNRTHSHQSLPRVTISHSPWTWASPSG